MNVSLMFVFSGNFQFETGLLSVNVVISCSAGCTGNPGSVILPQYGSSKITFFEWGKNTILKFLGK